MRSIATSFRSRVNSAWSTLRVAATRCGRGVTSRCPNPEPQQIDVRFQIARRLRHRHAPDRHQPHRLLPKLVTEFPSDPSHIPPPKP